MLFHKIFKHELYYKGGGGGGAVTQVVSTPAPTPPTKGEAKNITSSSLIKPYRRIGRGSTIVSDAGSFQSQLKSLLGS
jgi:hypothetical protein